MKLTISANRGQTPESFLTCSESEFEPRSALHHHTQNPTLHPVGFFLTTPAYSLGFQRVLADFDVFSEAKNSAIFALSGPIVSATQRTQNGRSPQRKMNISIKINMLRAD